MAMHGRRLGRSAGVGWGWGEWGGEVRALVSGVGVRFVLGFVSPGYTMWGARVAPYSAVSQPLSGLGLGPTGSAMNAIFIVSGLLIVVGAIGVFRAIPELSPTVRWIGVALLALPGVGFVLGGIFNL